MRTEELLHFLLLFVVVSGLLLVLLHLSEWLRVLVCLLDGPIHLGCLRFAFDVDLWILDVLNHIVRILDLD